MSTDGMIGEIRVFAGNFIPRGWAACDGSLLPISQNTALFSIIGTIYGGDGKINFALPDLRGQTALGTGSAPGVPAVKEGQRVGVAAVTLKAEEVPPHSHPLQRKGSTDVSQKTFAIGTDSNLAQISHIYGTGQHELVPHLLQNVTPNSTLAAASISPASGDQAHDNMQPYLVLNYAICLYGLYPMRP